MRKKGQTSSGLGNLTEITLGDTTNGNHTSLDKVLHGGRVNALGGEDDVGTSAKDHLNTLLGDVHLALLNGVDLRGIGESELDSVVEFCFVEVKIDASNLCVADLFWHRCVAPPSL